MSYTAAQKLEIILLVQQSLLSVRRTLEQMIIPRSTLLSLVRSLSRPPD